MAVSRLNFRRAPFLPDERQKEAIEHVDGPLLVIAGAGTGKTSVLTSRIERLVRDGYAQPDEILALTYTNNAAAEMRERLCKLLGGKTVHAATFHDYCLDLLKRSQQEFGVLDEQDLWIYLRRRIRDLHLEHYLRAANLGQFLSDLLKFIDRCHDELVTPEKYAQYVDRLERKEVPLPRVAKSNNDLDDAEVLGRCREIARVFSTVENWLKEDNLGTFSHMIVRAHALLAGDEKLADAARSRARFVLADEFQDANFAQVQILRRLVGSDGNIFAVGDPDQAIYRFRGASSAAFELFKHAFPKFRFVELVRNHRSTGPILRSAFALIDRNPQVFDQDDEIDYRRSLLHSVRDEESAKLGPNAHCPVRVVVLAGKDAEGWEVVSSIRQVQKKSKCKWSDFAVLYRSHWHRDELVRQLAEADIPFVIERMDVSDTPEARDLVACLNGVVNVGDDVSIFRISALPIFRVNPEELRASLRAVYRESREGAAVSLFSVLDRVRGGSEVVAALQRTREKIDRAQVGARAALDIIIKEFALEAQSPAVHAIANFVGEWERKKVNKTTKVEELVDYLGYFREAGGVIPLNTPEDENAVRLITVHGAKGLEFAHVSILRANANSFPTCYRETLVAFPRELRDPDSVANDDDQVLHKQEERRLFYVAMTRARDLLRIYSREGRGKNKHPDGYMRELIENPGLGQWLKAVPAAGEQKSFDIFAGAAPASPFTSRTAAWFELPVIEGLHRRLSASAVDSYQRCGLQFKLDRDWHISAKPAAAMQYGAAMHTVLKDYFDSVRAGRPRSEEELLANFRSHLAAAGIQESYQREVYEKQGIIQLRDFFASARSILAQQVLHTEESFEIRVGETTVNGRIDRIDRQRDGTVAIVDYKTGKARDQEDADQSLQLSLYALAAEEKWGYKVDRVSFYNLEHNVSVDTKRTEADLLNARAQVEEAARGIAAGEFPMKVGMHCDFCAYQNLCPGKEKQFPQRVRVATQN